MKLLIDNWRWADVSLLSSNGKTHASAQHAYCHPVPPGSFCAVSRDTSVEHLIQTSLVLHIQPEEGIFIAIRRQRPAR